MSESYLLSSSLEDVGHLSSGKQYYIQHLLTASECITIRFTDSVSDESGGLLCCRDELVQQRSLSELLQIPTKIVFSDLVNFQRNQDWLLNDFKKRIETDSLLNAIQNSVFNEKTSLVHSINACLLQVDLFPSLRQHLTLLSLALPKTYSRTLNSALLSLLLAKEMRLTDKDTSDLFLAALSHDLGMLLVNPLVLHKEDKLDADEWRHIQQHLLLSVELLRSIPQLPLSVIQAVAEHHERCDGTGYPTAKVESEISLLGQILALTDSLAAIQYKRFNGLSTGLYDAANIIRMNQQAYLHRGYEILMAVLMRSQLPVKNVVAGDQTEEFVAEVKKKNRFILLWFDLLRDCLLSVGFRHGDRQLHALQNVIIHLATSIQGAGCLRMNDGDVMGEINPINQSITQQELEKIVINQQELLFHLQRLNRMLKIYLDANENTSSGINIKRLREGYQTVLSLLQH